MLKPVLGSQIQLGHPLANGLVGCWLMNEGGGDIVQDLSGNGNKGIFGSGAASPIWVPGKSGHAIRFDGGDQVNVATPPTFLETTILMRFKINTLANDGLLGRFNGDSGGNESNIYYDSDGWIIVSWYNTTNTQNTITANQNRTAGKWYDMAVTIKDGEQHIYVDGVLKNSDTDAGVIRSGVAGMWIGRAYTGGPCIADIEYVYIFNRTLSAGEIQDLYVNPFAIIQPTFSVWWYSGIGGEAPAAYGQVIMIGN